MLRAVQTFQREAKTLPDHLYEESVVSGQLQLHSQL